MSPRLLKHAPKRRRARRRFIKLPGGLPPAYGKEPFGGAQTRLIKYGASLRCFALTKLPSLPAIYAQNVTLDLPAALSSHVYPSMPDPSAVNSMFARIAGRYDLANRLLSGGVDLWWRRRLINAVRESTHRDVLDLATGSGDVAFALARRLPEAANVTGMDFCQPMLDQAVIKQTRADAPGKKIRFIPGDGLNLPCPDASFDALTVSFGLRNMADRHRALTEMHRVLRPGGRLHVLEFSQPHAWFAPLYYFYTRRILPSVAGWLTGDRDAYAYLNASIAAYPGHAAMTKELEAAGFQKVRAIRMTFGIVALHIGVA